MAQELSSQALDRTLPTKRSFPDLVAIALRQNGHGDRRYQREEQACRSHAEVYPSYSRPT